MTTDSNTSTHTAPRLADLPARDVLAVDGAGRPEDTAFTTAIAALFGTRAALGEAADVPLEGSYRQDGEPLHIDLHRPDGWRWQLVVPAAEGITADAVTAAGVDPRVHLVRQAEQRVARLVHRGPYADEQPSLDALHAFVAASGLAPAGPHTEVQVLRSLDALLLAPERVTYDVAVTDRAPGAAGRRVRPRPGGGVGRGHGRAVPRGHRERRRDRP